MNLYISEYRSPFGTLYLAASAIGLVHINLRSEEAFSVWLTNYFPGSTVTTNEQKLRETIWQLEEYFAGKREQFDLPFDLIGTEFQKKVWLALRDIPFGTTVSYKQVAEKIGNPKAVRAVGLANNRNPVPIVIPCHRVIGANGKLVGYGGGLELKRQLLIHEGVQVARG